LTRWLGLLIKPVGELTQTTPARALLAVALAFLRGAFAS
jgi:hypothetical protein